MSFQAVTWAINQDVSGNDKLVLILLANRMNPDHGYCWPKIEKIADEAGLSYSTVQRCLKKLIECGMVAVSRERRNDGSYNGFVYFLCDDQISPQWREFSTTGQIDRTGLTTGQIDNRHRSNCPLTTGQIDRTIETVSRNSKINSKTPLSPPRGRATKGTRLPDDWEPTEEMIQFASDLNLGAFAIAESFRDYWIAVPGAKGVKLDWAATWRNWCRSEAKRGNRGQSQQTRAQRVRDAWAGVPDIEGV